MKKEEIKEIVKSHYSNVAKAGSCCSCGCKDKTSDEIAKSIGYSDEDVSSLADANLGLGCGNPTAMAKIKEGSIVLDLGSGAGFDCFIAARQVGKAGKVIGVDFSEDMLTKARENAAKLKYKNVEFRYGDIEALPIEDNSIDIVISNCVINLAPDKSRVFNEAYRVLRKGGKAFVSDIVLLGELTSEQKNDEELLSGCVGGALLKDDYIKIALDAGFKINVLSEDKEISKRQYQGIALESLKIEAIKL